MDLEREDLRPRYRLCGLGFGLIGAGLGLLCLSTGVFLIAFFTRSHELFRIIQAPWWDWLVGAPITFATVLGTYLLWGRWPEPSWQRPAGLLVMMNLVDLGLWTADHAPALGLGAGIPDAYQWIFSNFSLALNFGEFALFSLLAAHMAGHLGQDDAPDRGNRAFALAIAGLALTAIVFLLLTDWRRLPPLQVPIRHMELVLLALAPQALLLAAAIQVTALCVRASRLCARVVRDLDREASGHDLLKSRSEQDDAWT